MIRHPPRSTLFPDPTLFRSEEHGGEHAASPAGRREVRRRLRLVCVGLQGGGHLRDGLGGLGAQLPVVLDGGGVEDVAEGDRKSTRPNSSHPNTRSTALWLEP